MSNLATIQSELNTDLVAAGVQNVLPEHVSMAAFVRSASIAILKNKSLINCTKDSMVLALTQCASHGLLPDGKEAAIIPFGKDAQYLPMVDGVLKRARMSGQVPVLAAKAVYENDTFDYWMDEDGEHIKYQPKITDRGAFKLAFALAKLESGDLVIEIMPAEEVDKVRAASKSKNSPAWNEWYDRMACKSVLHRIARRLPNASEITELTASGIEFDDLRDVTPQDQPTAKELDDQVLSKSGAPEVDLVMFYKQSIDSCPDLPTLETCGNDIAANEDLKQLPKDQLLEIKRYYDKQLKQYKKI